MTRQHVWSIVGCRHRWSAAAGLDERGMALFAALLTATLVAALASALVFGSSSETAVAANLREAVRARLAAEAAMMAVVAGLRTTADWTDLPGGAMLAPFADGPPTGTRTLDDGSSIDLDETLNLAGCGRRTPCSTANLSQTTENRPWGPGNPQWRPFGAAYLGDLTESAIPDHQCLVVTFLADDPAENDGDRARDGVEVGGAPNPGRGVLMLRAEAFCARRAHKVIEATIARSGMPGDTVAAGWVVSRRELN